VAEQHRPHAVGVRAPDARDVEHLARAVGGRAARRAEPAKAQLGAGPLEQHAGRPAPAVVEARERAAARGVGEIFFRDDDRAAAEPREHIRPVKLSVEPTNRIVVGHEVERVFVAASEAGRLPLDRTG
jgi:hypothetical protein